MSALKKAVVSTAGASVAAYFEGVKVSICAKVTGVGENMGNVCAGRRTAMLLCAGA